MLNIKLNCIVSLNQSAYGCPFRRSFSKTSKFKENLNRFQKILLEYQKKKQDQLKICIHAFKTKSWDTFLFELSKTLREISLLLFVGSCLSFLLLGYNDHIWLFRSIVVFFIFFVMFLIAGISPDFKKLYFIKPWWVLNDLCLIDQAKEPQRYYEVLAIANIVIALWTGVFIIVFGLLWGSAIIGILVIIYLIYGYLYGLEIKLDHIKKKSKIKVDSKKSTSNRSQHIRGFHSSLPTRSDDENDTTSFVRKLRKLYRLDEKNDDTSRHKLRNSLNYSADELKLAKSPRQTRVCIESTYRYLLYENTNAVLPVSTINRMGTLIGSNLNDPNTKTTIELFKNTKALNRFRDDDLRTNPQTEFFRANGKQVYNKVVTTAAFDPYAEMLKKVVNTSKALKLAVGTGLIVAGVTEVTKEWYQKNKTVPPTTKGTNKPA